MNNNIVPLDDLRKLTGYKPVNKVADALRAKRIKFIRTEKALFTTIDAINTAMELNDNESDKYSP